MTASHDDHVDPAGRTDRASRDDVVARLDQLAAASAARESELLAIADAVPAVVSRRRTVTSLGTDLRRWAAGRLRRPSAG